MDLDKLKELKKKEKSIPVRIKEPLYNDLRHISQKEDISVIKIVEFFLESAISEYSLLKQGQKKKDNKGSIDLDYTLDLFFNLLDVHAKTVKEGNLEHSIKSLDDIKAVLKNKKLYTKK